MQPYVEDSDFTLYVGDALETLRELPDESVDCVVTSPPYWGLRDYGTGEWEGGDEGCDHLAPLGGGTGATGLMQDGRTDEARQGNAERVVADRQQQYRDTCGKCGARRIDQQLGLEPTPDQYVTRMVEVFREVRRVLAKHGTCWVNLGDSYAANYGNGGKGNTGAAGSIDKRGAGAKPKDLVGVPWRVAFALQADGWYLRSDIIWSKPNPMPESVTDRPTKAHEYVFLLTKQPRYWFDQEAVREDSSLSSLERAHLGDNGSKRPRDFAPDAWPTSSRNPPRTYGAGRNIRSVWEIATQPYPEAHFATFPEELARRCILAGCPERVCRVCGKPSERLVERSGGATGQSWGNHADDSAKGNFKRLGKEVRASTGFGDYRRDLLGWSDCGCLLSGPETMRKGDPSVQLSSEPRFSGPESKWRPGVVLDPFLGSGTVALVARNHGRHAIGIELSPEYAELAARRTRQLSLLA